MRDDDPPTKPTESSERSTPKRSGPSRRQILAASAGLGAGAVAGAPVGSASAEQEGDDEDADDQTADEDVDEPEGFEVEVLAEPATFPDDVAAMFSVRYDADGADDGGTTDNGTTDDDGTTIDSNLPWDASSLVVVEARWEPGGTSGWHSHPGVGIVNVAEGEIEIVDAHDCASRTYAAGEAFLDPADHVHTAPNASDTEPAAAYVTFLGVPEEGPVTEWVEPQDC